METITKIVRGKYFDGCDESDTDYVAKKINDIATEAVAGTLHSISVFIQGNLLVATIVYTEAA